MNKQAEATSRPGAIGVVLCTCGGTLFSEQEAQKIAAGLTAPGPVFLQANLCSAAEQKSLAKQLRQAKLDRLVFAGCSSSGRGDLHQAIARQAGLAPSSVLPVDLKRAGSGKGAARLKSAATRIQKGLGALYLMPAFRTEQVPVEQRALVIGAGPAGVHTAAALRSLGIAATLVEQRESLGPEAMGILAGGGATLPRSLEALTGSSLLELRGHVGRFEARVRTPKGVQSVSAGAVVVAAGIPGADNGSWPYTGGATVPLSALAEAVEKLPRRRGVRSIAMLLDARFEEGKASMRCALELAARLQDPERLQVHLLCREARVAALPLEALYDEVREAGVDIVKYDGAPQLSPTGAEGVIVTYRDALLGSEAALECDLVGVSSPGIQPAADPRLAELTGVSTDAEGRFQENNIHLFPEATNRKGVFVVGSVRGQFDLSQILAEARAAALAVSSLLAPGSIEVETSNPVVDPDKCVLCLTCVRACPYGAMQVDHAKGAAASVAEACQRCGICAGECPAKAIELPAYSDAVLYSYLG